MKKTLILFAHPRYEKSRINRIILRHLTDSENILVHDLYEAYPDFNIDIEHEKMLLLRHDTIVWHHPFYMYSAPAMLKQWVDTVLEFGWAHGAEGNYLKDKTCFNCITSGGTRESYQKDGSNRFTLGELIYPFEQTAYLCKMNYLPPFAVQGTYRLTTEEIEEYAKDYLTLLDLLSSGSYRQEEMRRHSLLNDWLAAKKEREE
jgi:glutathione-regulated potassium-efflux system ancillary protein KefG